MAKKAYIGIDGTARKVKKIYLGIDDVARRVKKAYIGIGGVARPILSADCPVTLYGNLAFNTYASDVGATTIGDYALFGGGFNSSGDAVVTTRCVDKSLSNASSAALISALGSPVAGTLGQYAIFAGGGSSSVATTYNNSLTRGRVSVVGNSLIYPAGAVVGDYMLLAGGYTYNSTSGVYNYYRSVYSISKSLTVKTQPNLSYTASSMKVATLGGQVAIFGGGFNANGPISNLTVYNSSLTKTQVESTYLGARWCHTAVAMGQYAIFAGGTNYTTPAPRYALDTIVVYNASLTCIASGLTMAQPRLGLSSATVGNHLILFGGLNAANDYIPYEIYDQNLTRVFEGYDAIYPTHYGASAVLDNYALFVGGIQSVTQSYNTQPTVFRYIEE